MELREAIANHLQHFRGMNVNPDNIIVGAGTEYLYSIIVQLLGRDKVIAALLRNDIEENLGFSGSGQEVSIMRSTLLNKSILCEGFMGISVLNMEPEDIHMAEVLTTIKAVIFEARTLGPIPFREIYRRLCRISYRVKRWCYSDLCSCSIP